ncbi:MAG: carbohydrate binding family 9 domain-containing protein [Acidobacteria bacterium]|nr:carbohydrate binding family 9 domain-containing protein [Acidobacteriota bacterium]
MMRMRWTLGLVLFVIVSLPSDADAQESPAERRRMRAFPMGPEDRIVLDGILDEEIWASAEPAAHFIQQEPNFGAPETERTEVRIVFNRESLYMGVICYDSEPHKLAGYQRRRDEFLSADDRFMWTIDTYLDGRGGYFFETNPSGLMADSLIGLNQNNRQWDGIWTAKVRRSEIGWTAEIEIPFRTLNFDPDAPAWGINFQRTVRRKNEETLWTGHARNQGLRRMSNAGFLTGIQEVSQGKGLDVKPYALGTAIQSPGRAQQKANYLGDAGIDVFYSPTPRLRTNFTLNTDFAQTEVDQRQVNLTRFSLFFPEKRDFFLEGASFFDFRSTAEDEENTRLHPFFSRTIGLHQIGQSSAFEPQKIDFGTKLTGQVGRQDVGLLHVQTGREGEVLGEDFTVMRLKRRFWRQSYVGGMMTRRDPRAPGDTRYTTGLDALLATSNFLGSENLELGAYALRATNQEGRHGGNYAYGLELNYPNDVWSGSLTYREIQENFDPAVGFVSQRGYRRLNPAWKYSPRPRGHGWIRQFGFGFDLDRQTDMDNELLTRKWDFRIFEVNTHSGDTFYASILPQRERLEENFGIRVDPKKVITLPAGNEYDFLRYRWRMQTANKRKLAAVAEVEMGEFFSGDRQSYIFELTLRVRPGVIIYSGVEWNRLQLQEGNFQTRIYRLTPELQFSPWISFVNKIQYDNVSRVLGWQSRFRWILKPGNDFYLVYAQNWEDEPMKALRTLDRRATTKFVYTHRF